jgi:ABC-type lipopolysaccharide export system ATPase subunit
MPVNQVTRFIIMNRAFLPAEVFGIGKIALSGDSKSLSEDPRIKKAYLGA